MPEVWTWNNVELESLIFTEFTVDLFQRQDKVIEKSKHNMLEPASLPVSVIVPRPDRERCVFAIGLCGRLNDYQDAEMKFLQNSELLYRSTKGLIWFLTRTWRSQD